MRHNLRIETRIGDVVAAAFDEAARFTLDAHEQSRLAHHTVTQALRGRSTAGRRRRIDALVEA